MPLYNKDYIKKMTVEDFLKLCGIDPDDDESLATFIREQADTDCTVDVNSGDPACQFCVYSDEDDASAFCDSGVVCEEGIVQWLNLERKESIVPLDEGEERYRYEHKDELEE